MYINVKLTPEKEEEIQNKVNTMFEESLTNERLEELFLECYRGQIKGVITELCQSKDFRSMLTDKVVPVLMEKLELAVSPIRYFDANKGE